jgi:hypothetical protein
MGKLLMIELTTTDVSAQKAAIFMGSMLREFQSLSLI